MNKKLLSLYSLKFNPFSPEVPTSALWSAPSIESFCWRIEQQIGEGGFALAIDDPGTLVSPLALRPKASVGKVISVWRVFHRRAAFLPYSGQLYPLADPSL